jgi:catalase
VALSARPGPAPLAGRRIALMIAQGADGAALQLAYDRLVDAGAAPRFIGAKLGKVLAAAGSSIEVEATLETMPSAMWDAVVIDGSADALARVGVAVELQFRHGKAMLIAGDAPALLAAAGLADMPSDTGFIAMNGGKPALEDALAAFVKAVASHKHYERETDPAAV